MSIETLCPGCGRKLRVAAEHAGKQARCPLCNAIYTVSAAESATDIPSDPAAATQSWRMRSPEGQTYGPVERTELDRWVSEGRVTADCELHCEGTGRWQGAAEVYAALRPQAQTAAAATAESPEAQRRYRYMESHRGVLILALGILSWVSCPIFGIVAWVLGNRDLREMRAGRMDPSGMRLTQAGQILGMIHAIIVMAVIVLGAFVLLASFVMSQL